MQNSITAQSIGDTNFINRLIKIFILITIAVSIGIPIYHTIDEPSDKPIDIPSDTDIDWNKPPCNPDELSEDWKEVTDSRMKQFSNRREFIYKDTYIKIAFDIGRSGEPKFRGRNHWHRYNPNTTNRHDVYLDRNGNPTGENSNDSHIDPECQ